MEMREQRRSFERAASPFRSFGPFGPVYEVLETRGDVVRIRVMDSGEELDYPTARSADDPEA